MTRSDTVNNIGFDLYIDGDNHFKNVGRLETAREILNTNDDVTLLRYYTIDGSRFDEYKTV